ncbi:MAG: hypothetical protein HY905_27275 [Deltaproteobacteria bacterium]|nr:hypothetical protein [Deltaproteobacteria bacterium]
MMTHRSFRATLPPDSSSLSAADARHDRRRILALLAAAGMAASAGCLAFSQSGPYAPSGPLEAFHEQYGVAFQAMSGDPRVAGLLESAAAGGSVGPADLAAEPSFRAGLDVIRSDPASAAAMPEDMRAYCSGLWTQAEGAYNSPGTYNEFFRAQLIRNWGDCAFEHGMFVLQRAMAAAPAGSAAHPDACLDHLETLAQYRDAEVAALRAEAERDNVSEGQVELARALNEQVGRCLALRILGVDPGAP